MDWAWLVPLFVLALAIPGPNLRRRPPLAK
jgi:hypothetical protein